MIWIITTVVFALLFAVSLVLGLRVSRQARAWEVLFLDTLEDMQNSAEIFHTLVNRRSLLSDDPDVQRIKQVFGVTLDILGEYITNGKEFAKRAKKKEEEAG